MLAVRNDTRTDIDGLTLMVGLGETGLSVAEHLVMEGVPVRIADDRERPPRLSEAQHLDSVEIVTGEFGTSLLDGVSRVVLSPGLPADIPLALAAKDREIPVVGDIDLFCERATCPVLGITGSNGKSTVTSLTTELLKAAGHVAAAGGNLGPPALNILREKELDFAVLELSSFQLEINMAFTVQAGALLNISADHMDRHGSASRYQELKSRLLDKAGTIVVNRDDPTVMYLAEGCESIVSFGLSEVPHPHFGIVKRGGEKFLAQGDRELIPISALKLPGTHNQSNVLAALALCAAVGVEPERVVAKAAEFSGLAHRCQFVRTVNDVVYLNDSKATNPAATAAALSGLSAPLILIAGGQGKDADFAEVARVAQGRVRCAYLFGRDKEKLAAALKGSSDLVMVDDLAQAVSAASQIAEPGDTVILSPACASQDMFADFTERGRTFMELVEALQ